MARRFGFEPYEAGRLVYAPGSRPYIFYLKLRPGVLAEAGALSRVLEVFEEFGVPVLQFKVSAPLPGAGARAIVIADLSGREDAAGRIVEMLEKLPGVVSAGCDEPLIDGLALDLRSFPLRLAGGRAVILRVDIYGGLIKGGWERFGSGYGQLLYIVGFEIGRKMYRAHSRIAGELAERFHEGVFQVTGLGVVRIVELDDSGFRAVVRVYDSFECELFRGVGEIRGNLVRGMLAGWLAERWGGLGFDQVTAREVKCIARGDPHCEYHIWIDKLRS